MRTNSYSSLDFTYWLLAGVTENYAATDDAIYTPSTDGDIMHGAICDAASICGLKTPRTLEALLAESSRQKTMISPEKAIRTRGALLVKAGCPYVSVGDRHRLIGADSAGSISLFSMTIMELDPSYWNDTFLLPGMRYL